MAATGNRGGGRGSGPSADGPDLTILDLDDAGAGTIGLSDCPGVRLDRFRPELLGPDLDAIECWKPSAIFCPLLEGEVEHGELTDILYEIRRRGIVCAQLHKDAGDAAGFEREWPRLRDRLVAELHHGGRLLVMCAYGRSRTSRMVAWLEMERGATAEQAIATVRRQLPDALGDAPDLASVRGYVPKHAPGRS